MAMRHTSLFLTLLMLLAPLSAMVPATLHEAGREESYDQTEGWGEDAAGGTIVDGGLDWTLMGHRGVDDWVRASLADFSDAVEDLDVAIAPDQSARACGYNTTTGDLEVYTLSADGETSRVTVDSAGDVGRGCSIMVDYRGFARIAYLDVTAASLKVVRENEDTPFPGDDWLFRTLVNDVNITTSPEIAMYSNGTEAIAYRDNDTGGLHLMRFTGSWWRHTEMLGGGASPDIVLNIDVNDVLHLAFHDASLERVAVISLDGDARTYSLVDEGAGLGQPLGHHLDATTRAQLVYGIENGTGLRIVRDLEGRNDGRVAPSPFAVLESNESVDFGTGADATADFNADGYSDLVYAAPGAANATGEVHLHYGSDTGFAAVPDLSLTGAHPGAAFGSSLAPAGDVNGDGYADLWVGAPGEENASGVATGAAHLFTGFPTGLSTTATWTVHGGEDGGLFGALVAGAGDVDRDGFDDLLVAEHGWTGSDQGQGRVHVFEGGVVPDVNATMIPGHADDLILGWALIGIGDANGDGHADIAIGSSDDSTRVSGRGMAQIHLGSSAGIATTPDRSWSMSQQWTLFGNSISALGDIDGDGFDDIAVSEIFNSSVWVFTGGASGYGANPATILASNGSWGWAIAPAGDINDDGWTDFMVGSPSAGGTGGFVGVYAGTNDSSIFSTQVEFLTQSGAANARLGRLLSAGGDADRDGTHEFLFASTETMVDGTTGGHIVLYETRDWELSDLPFDFTVDSLDLAVDAQGRTQLLLDTDQGVHHFERANERLSSADPWASTDLGSLSASAMAVTPAGQPVIVSSAGAGLDFDRREGAVLVQHTPLSASGPGTGLWGSVHASIAGRTMSAFTVGSSLIFVNQTGTDFANTVVESSAQLDAATHLLSDANGTPHLVWRDAASDQIELAVQNGSGWDRTTLVSGADRPQLDVLLAANGDLALLSHSSTTGLVLSQHAAVNGSWTTLSSANLSNATHASAPVALHLANGLHEAVWLDDNSSWHHLLNASGNATEVALPAMNASAGMPHLLGSGLLLPGILVNGSGSHVLVGVTGADPFNLGCADADDVRLIHQAGADWVLCEEASGDLMAAPLGGDREVILSGSGLAGASTQTPVAAFVDANDTWHLQYANAGNEAVILHRLSDLDRDFIPDIVDDLPRIGGQWTDSDGDGYGENPDAPMLDACPSLAGTSAYGHNGCADADGDGYANAVDDCADSGKSWKDVLGCDDTDGDGWSDPSGEPGWDGDRHPTNWMQSIDTDGDGRYDNHGPDCCGQNTNSDEFPLDPQQWEDLDDDGWGDNSSAPTGDKCPGFAGSSMHDRGGCLDSDGDGWSDPVEPSTQNPEGWSYNRTRCYSEGVHCADLFPWAADDTDPENICADRCHEQWADRDGDGYGDNSTIGAWNRDAFPLDWTQYLDSDEDGWGDNESGNNPDDCPFMWGNSTIDRSGCEDADGDGHSNVYTFETNQSTGLREQELGDALPNDPNQWRDRDGDGFGENGIDGTDWDRCPTIPGFLAGVPGPGCPMPEGDADGDGVLDEDDHCPDTPPTELADENGCSMSQTDSDGDGVVDLIDACPATPPGEAVNLVGCSVTETDIDTDGDGVNDRDALGELLDTCPWTDLGAEVDENGCAANQRDSDLDGVMDDEDICPGTTHGATVDAVGCIVAGADADEDGVEDVDDAFPLEPTQWTDTDGDGFGDNWADPAWDTVREGGVGQFVENASQPDSCPLVAGNSTADRHGCPDADRDLYSDPDAGWLAHPQGQADAFPQNATQWRDQDGDGFGDNDPGFKADKCPNTAGIAGGDGGDGCPAPVTPPWEDLDDDQDYVKNGEDDCPNTPADEWSRVDDNGCSPSQLETEDSGGLLDGPMLYVAYAMGGIFGIALLLLIIGRVRRGGIDWDDEDDLLDDDDEWEDDDDEDGDWSPFGGGSAPVRSSPSGMPSRGPPSGAGPGPGSRGPPGGAGPSRGSRGPPGGGGRGPSPGSRGPPGGGGGGFSAGASFGGDAPSTSAGPGPSRGPGPGSNRPGGPARPGKGPGASAPGQTQTRKTRRTAAGPKPTQEAPVRKTRRTSRPEAASSKTDAPLRRTRRTRRTTSTAPEPDPEPQASAGPKRSRRRKAGFDTLFDADQKAEFDAAVAEARERMIVGDSEHTVLARLQSEGWNVKQSKMIVGHARK